MDAILYILIFCMGTLFGSFFTLAVYRIPLHQDITHTRSYCPKCNHKLSFLDMIPILSYIFLKGKCRYCKERIRPRYLLLEILSGIVFVLFALSFKLSMFTLTVPAIAYLVVGLLYIATLFIIAGIDKEKIKIEKPVLLFGFICVTIYIIYLYIIEKDPSIYGYAIYLILTCIVLGINTISLRNKTKDNYVLNILLLSILMIMFTYEISYIFTVTITLSAVGIKLLLSKLQKRKIKCVKGKNENHVTKIPFGFYLCVSNIVVMLVINYSIFYR